MQDENGAAPADAPAGAPDSRRTPARHRSPRHGGWWLALPLCLVVVLVVGLVVTGWRPGWLGGTPGAVATTSAGSATGLPTVGPTSADPAPSTEPAATPTPDPAEPVLAAIDPDTTGPSADGVRALVDQYVASGRLGPSPGVVVVDALSGDRLAGEGAGVARMPASTTKVLTATAALAVLGADTRFETIIAEGDSGEIVIVGGGDPTLTSRPDPDPRWVYPATRLAPLVNAAAARLRAEGITQIRLGYATDLFDPPAVNPAWEPSYTSFEVGPVTALAVDNGRARPGVSTRVTDPARAAADAVAALLNDAGITVVGTPTPRPSAGAGAVLARAASPTVATLVHQMLQRSDNDVAEVLAHHVARALGHPATFAGAATAMEQALGDLGVDTDGLVLRDGSGLARGNRITSATLASALHLAYASDDPALRTAITGLPVAGFTGSLTNRFESDAAAPQAGDVRAKTGFLTGVVSLAGVVVDDEERPMIFAVIADGITYGQTIDVQTAVDELVAELAACGCDAQP